MTMDDAPVTTTPDGTTTKEHMRPNPQTERAFYVRHDAEESKGNPNSLTVYADITLIARVLPLLGGRRKGVRHALGA